ncbi:MAG TPA: hypothetical protein VL359_14515, partial [bacterium]|nr:hypothetical protein [bacterium]
MADSAAPFALLKLEERAAGETLALIRQARALPQVRTWAGELERFLPKDAEGECREYLRLALLGVCAGFAE